MAQDGAGHDSSDAVVPVPEISATDLEEIETDDETPESGPVPAATSPDTAATDSVEIPVAVDTAESLDRLLAISASDDWSVEGQVQSLKDLAAEDGPAPPPRIPSKPPPLPHGGRTSRPPPPLPDAVSASKRPPPLPSAPPSSPPASPSPSPSAPPVAPALLPVDRPSSKTTRTTKLATEAVTLAEGIGPQVVEDLDKALKARLGELQRSSDRVSFARAHVELSISRELFSLEETEATRSAEEALSIDPRLPVAHSILRRRTHGKPHLSSMLKHLEHELAFASQEVKSVALLVEKARLLAALADGGDTAKNAWELALVRSPNDAAALKGLEAELADRTFSGAKDAAEALATHLAKMADAYAGEPALAAWIHVERAELLEWKLQKSDAARSALERALALDPSVGPVRNALVAHVARHSDANGLAMLLAEEAGIEQDAHRAARLEVEAASLFHTKLKDDLRSIALLESAASRAPTTPSIDRRVLDDLVHLYESTSRWHDVARIRKKRLTFFTAPKALIFELQALATVDERLGDLSAAIEHIERALELDTNDRSLLETLDRLLKDVGKHEHRVALWLAQSTRTADPTKRARALCRAADLAENALIKPDEAQKHLRAAWVAAPGDAEVLDSLSRLMSPSPSEAFDGEVRMLIELYSQAAQTTKEEGRKIAYLEKIALLWEELLGDARRAARAFEEILDKDPTRRSAVLGLARTAARINDDRALARALLDESKLAEGRENIHSLKVRAATVLARVEKSRALAIVEEVLSENGQHEAARALETTLHEDAGRWELASSSLRARIDASKSKDEKVSLSLALAHIQASRLRSPTEALKALEAARSFDPTHPVPPAEIARVLEQSGNDRTLRDALLGLADTSTSREERARYLARAAEIDELRLDDDGAAKTLYRRALEETPADAFVAARLERVLERLRARGDDSATDELANHLESRLAKTDPGRRKNDAAISLALVWLQRGRRPERTTELLEEVLTNDSRNIASLRLLEMLARKLRTWTPLSRASKMQGESFADLRARLGAYWTLAFLEEWKLPGADPTTTYAAIVDLDPTDAGALEALFRRDMPSAKKGDRQAIERLIRSLPSLAAVEDDPFSVVAIELRLGLLLESSAGMDASSEGAAALALEHFRIAQRLDNESVTAATALLRLSRLLADADGFIEASVSLANLTKDSKERSRHLLQAAERILAADPSPERDGRAGELLEAALVSDPDAVSVIGRLAQLRTESRQGEKLVDPFKAALTKAASGAAIVLLGGEIARVARDDLGDLNIGIDALRTVRASVPDHVPSLLTLAELCIAQRAWPEAVNTLEDVVERGQEPAPRLTALFTLASVYEKVLARPEETEKALRRALGIEGDNPKALRALIHCLATKQKEVDRDGGEDGTFGLIRHEIASLLERLAQVESDRYERSEILLELVDVRFALGERTAAEKALIDAIAYASDRERPFARLRTLFESKDEGFDSVAYARALVALIARGQQVSAVHPKWLATLGHLEIESLGRLRDGVNHMRQAVNASPELYETRVELAFALSRLGANDEASREFMSLLEDNPLPIAHVRNPGSTLELFERTLNAERRVEEAVVVSELQAICGALDDARQKWLRDRRIAPLESHHTPLDRAALVGHVVPKDAQHPFLEVAGILLGLESKVLRADLGEVGLTAKDKLGRRSGHPVRARLDRLAKAIGVSDVEIAISPTATRTRVLNSDVPWIVLPKAVAELPEPGQLAAIGRGLARIALGVPWLEELPPAHIEAYLVAAARQAVPGYGKDLLDAAGARLASQYELAVQRDLSRKQKQALEKLAPTLASKASFSVERFVEALAKAELRISYILNGDILAAIDELRSVDPGFMRATRTAGAPSLISVLEHPFAGDLIRFALGGEASALRRRIGSTWAS